MNPKISITVDAKNKAIASLTGMVTVGAKVDVEIRGIVPESVPEWAEDDDFTGKSLRFRIVDGCGRDLVRFPLVRKGDDTDGDKWTVTDDGVFVTQTEVDGSPVVDFNTDRLRKEFCGVAFNSLLEFGVIIDSIVDDAQYAVGKIKVRQWSACPADDPTILPDWRMTLRRLHEDLAGVEQSKADAEGAKDAAIAARDESVIAKNAAQSFADAALGYKNDSQSSANAASASAEQAEEQVSKYPYIDDETNHWMVWSAAEGKFVDTGIKASGSVEFDDIPTEGSQKAARSGGIWSWVKSLLPSWLKPGTPAPDTGEARPLPKYLHALSFDDTYPAEAEAFYTEIAGDASAFGCSAIRRGGKLYRNYDWTFDDAAEFVVRVSGNESRFASVGVASVGTKLTEADVTSGRWSKYYKALPGMTLDGINEKGLVAEINVDGGPKDGWNGTGTNAIHILGAVRWVLDHGETAAQAAAYLAANIKRPTGDMNFHFMIADATATYIVENGESHDITDAEENVLTNFNLFNRTGTVEHGGIERYLLLAGGAPITDAWFTNAYQEGNTWDSDFDSAAQHAAAITAWGEQGETKEAHRNKTTSGGKAWWHTKHTSEYDFAAKTLKVAVQESEDWYVFAVDAQGITEVPPHASTHAADGDDPITVAQSQVTGLADALAAKRGMTDRDWKGNAPLKWTITGGGGALREQLVGEYTYDADEQKWKAPDTTYYVRWIVYNLTSHKFEHWNKTSYSIMPLKTAEWSGANQLVDYDINGYLYTITPTGSVDVEVVTDTLALTSEVPTTAAQVGAVAKSGDTMTGALNINYGRNDISVYIDADGIWITDRHGIERGITFPSFDGVFALFSDITTAVSPKADKSDFALDSQGHPVGSYLSNLFSTSNSYLMGTIRYELYSVPTTGEGANTLKDRAINAFTYSGGNLPAFPEQVAGYARDFLLNVTATADGSDITLPETGATSIGDALAFTAGKTYLVAITEIAAKQYYIRVIDTTPANSAA